MRKKALITIWFLLMVAIGSTITYASFNYEDENINNDNKVVENEDASNSKDKTDYEKNPTTTKIKEYKKIVFTNYSLDSKANVQLSKYQNLVEIKNKKIFIDGKETTIENDLDEIYIVDIDLDKTMEIITCTIDETIIPNSHNYHIYKYDNKDIKEILKISILGSMNTIFTDGKELKIEYIPEGSDLNNKKEELYFLNK